MPKPTKLHSKGKSGSMQKICSVDTNEQGNPEEAARQFQLELCWCIQQLEKTLNEKKGTEKQLQETWKTLTVLKNNNQPVIRKRQLMRTHFGDYRSKMAAEEKKLVKMTNKIKITESPSQAKAMFLRKSAFLTTGDQAFRFNFDLAADQIDDGNSNIIEKNDRNIEEVKSEKIVSDPDKKFKFTFTSSEFKFNFNPSNA